MGEKVGERHQAPCLYVNLMIQPEFTVCLVATLSPTDVELVDRRTSEIRNFPSNQIMRIDSDREGKGSKLQ